MYLHTENMKQISKEHKFQYDARELEVYNKEHDIAEQVRLQQVRNYISSRIEDCNILNEHLKAKYDNHMNDLLEKLHNVYNEINKINDNDNMIARAHTAAVQHSVHQALLQDNKRIKTYNKKQYEKKCILDELVRICKLEQTQILQVKQFQYQHDMYMMSNDCTVSRGNCTVANGDYRVCLYKTDCTTSNTGFRVTNGDCTNTNTNTNYNYYNYNQQNKFEEQLKQERELERELKREEELKLKLELEREQELKLKQNLISDTNEWLNGVD